MTIDANHSDSGERRWDVVSSIVGEAMARSPADRRGYITTACGNDEALRREVESLVTAAERAPDWLETLSATIVEPARRVLVEPTRHDDAAPHRAHRGRCVLHYDIEEQLGAGGMGVVYRAHDQRLGRSVALKFIAPGLLADPSSVKRLVREARAASQLDHPNICTIYGIEELPDGELCLAMALCEGGTLRDRLHRGPLPVSVAVDIAQQIAAALAHAHERGIVHRDLKPANIAFASDGRIRLLDFGIAAVRSNAALASGAGRGAGTLAYAAPEQIHGAPSDARADVWSLGVTLYEMLAGRRPFTGDDDPALLFAILDSTPAALGSLRDDIPPELAQLVDRMLRKSPEDRPRDAGEVLAALRAPADGSPQATPVALAIPSRNSRFRVTSTRGLVPIGFVGLLGIAAVVGLDRMRNRETSSAAVASSGVAAEEPSSPAVPVAVLPFAIRGAPELAYLRDGMVDLLATTLDGVGELRGVDPNAVLGLVAQEPSQVLDPASGRMLASRLGAERYVLGSVVQLGDRLQLNAALYDSSGTELARAQVVIDGESDLMLGVDELARQLAATELRDPAERLAGLAAATTHSLPALRAYLEGERLLRDARPEAAIERLREAVRLDSMFALAWYRLARAAGWRGVDSLNLAASERAFARADSLPPRANAIVRAYYELRMGDPREAERQLRRILAAHPDDAESWLLLGEALFHNNPAQGRATAEARAPLLEVMRRDPRNREITVHLMDLAARERRTGTLDTLFRMYFSPNSEGERLDVRYAYLALHAQAAGATARADSVLGAFPDAGPEIIATALDRIGPQLGDLRLIERLATMLAEEENPAEARVQGFLSLATVSLARGRWSAAQRLWDSASVLQPGPTLVHRALAAAMPFAPITADTVLALRDRLSAWSIVRAPLIDGLSVDEQETIRSYLIGLLSVQGGDGVLGAASRQALLRKAREQTDSRLANAFGASLLGYAAWKRRQARESISALESAPLAWPFSRRDRSPVLEQYLDRFTRAEALLALGRADEALDWYEALTDGYQVWGFAYLGPVLARRAEIAERRGETRDALAHYEEFVRLWSGADPELQPRVRQVRERIEQLRR